MKFGRRDFLKATACVPALATISFGLVEEIKPNISHLETHWWGGKVKVCTGTIPDMPGSHVEFAPNLPFTGSWISFKVVPKEKWKKHSTGRWVVKRPAGLHQIDAELQVCIGAVCSELPMLLLPVKPRERFWIPFTFNKGVRISFRMKDNSVYATKYNVHAAITETV